MCDLDFANYSSDNWEFNQFCNGLQDERDEKKRVKIKTEFKIKRNYKQSQGINGDFFVRNEKTKRLG